MRKVLLISMGYTTLVIILLFILILAPREKIRVIRQALNKGNMKIWAKGSLVHSIVAAFLWQRGNGNGHYE